MKQNDVVTVLTIAGEFVGKYDIANSTSEAITLKDPRMLIQTQEGMGFARGICVTGEENPTEVSIQNYVFLTPTNPEIEKAYRQAVSGLVL